MRADTRRVEELRAPEPSTIAVGHDESEESHTALGDGSASSSPRAAPSAATTVPAGPARTAAALDATPEVSRLTVGTFATGMSAAGTLTVRRGRPVGTYATGQAKR